MQTPKLTPIILPIINPLALPNSDFFEYCTIHGVKEMKRSENWPTMAFWLIVMLGCFTGVSYEIYQIMSFYKSNPGVTQVSWTAQKSYQYPPIAFCPKNWLSTSRAKRLNFTDHALSYVVSLLNTDVLVDDQFDENDVKRRVQSILKRKNIPDYMALLKLISYEGHEILRPYGGSPNVTFRPVVQSFGMCYMIDVEPIPANLLRTNVMLKLFVIPKESNKYDMRWQPRLLLKDSNGLKANFVSLTKRGIYIVELEAQVHTRMSRRDKFCVPEKDIHKMPTGGRDEYSVALCEFFCLERERLRRKCDFCLPIALMASMQMNPNDHNIEPCFYYKSAVEASASNATMITEEIDTESPGCSKSDMALVEADCSAECPVPCTQWRFKHSTSILSDDKTSGELVVWIAYNPMDGIMLYEEVPSYTLDTFISNIGGQLGLWLGSSIISIVQILYYACIAVCQRRRKMGTDEETIVNLQPTKLYIGSPNGLHDVNLPIVKLSGV